mmetsp:Transcript_13423/g.49878  ORF Transcript_13423/g.49878 Transcript_13423/m.49878 type:complete len:241 (+) Transcript_13423:6796-7518(+)
MVGGHARRRSGRCEVCECRRVSVHVALPLASWGILVPENTKEGCSAETPDVIIASRCGSCRIRRCDLSVVQRYLSPIELNRTRKSVRSRICNNVSSQCVTSFLQPGFKISFVEEVVTIGHVRGASTSVYRIRTGDPEVRVSVIPKLEEEATADLRPRGSGDALRKIIRGGLVKKDGFVPRAVVAINDSNPLVEVHRLGRAPIGVRQVGSCVYQGPLLIERVARRQVGVVRDAKLRSGAAS